MVLIIARKAWNSGTVKKISINMQPFVLQPADFAEGVLYFRQPSC